MYSSTFIFEPKQYDDEFHELDDDIAARARQIDGFLGEEVWQNEESGLLGQVYYWSTKEALTELIGMTQHRRAKELHDRWLSRYKVVISEVMTTYGDPDLALNHQPTA